MVKAYTEDELETIANMAFKEYKDLVEISRAVQRKPFGVLKTIYSMFKQNPQKCSGFITAGLEIEYAKEWRRNNKVGSYYAVGGMLEKLMDAAQSIETPRLDVADIDIRANMLKIILNGSQADRSSELTGLRQYTIKLASKSGMHLFPISLDTEYKDNVLSVRIDSDDFLKIRRWRYVFEVVKDQISKEGISKTGSHAGSLTHDYAEIKGVFHKLMPEFLNLVSERYEIVSVYEKGESIKIIVRDDPNDIDRIKRDIGSFLSNSCKKVYPMHKSYYTTLSRLIDIEAKPR